ncbi:hypothetical protein CMV30_09390 [Nibricoccus aquaticus]|uniref:Lipase modulator n=1 Tax=Nibricoccus aquaticus TaxID=2576891 RepID=A0A290QII6_9BACT|nr:hypothetical protein [Nibricoccus aquaticus]ATC64151.1 hypothetical protein CMV30_09390 [Nibricoccus aquaticus]
MKRALVILLLISLAANTVFLVRASRSLSTTSSASTPYPVSSDTSAHPGAQSHTAPTFPSTDWSASPNTLGFLRQLGLTDPEIRAIIRAEVDARYSASERALRKPPAYWEHTFSSHSAAHLDKITDPAAANDLARQKENELRQLLGDIYEPAHDQLRQYTRYLPFEKAWHLKLIYDDYRLLEFESKGRGTPLRLPTPREQASYLREQQRADIEALLTPEELYIHNIHTSNTASFLRNLVGFEATKQEFIALYELRKSLDHRRTTSAQDPALNELIDQQTRDLLGEKRYADYIRAQDPDFRANHDLATQLGLPPETALASYEYLKSLRAKFSDFTAQNNATDEQWNAFFAQTRQEMETTLTKLYGEKGFPAARDLIADRLSARVRNVDP